MNARMRRVGIWRYMNQVQALASCRLNQFQSTLWTRTHSIPPGSLGYLSIPSLVGASRQDQHTQVVAKTTSLLSPLDQRTRTPWHLACDMSERHSEKGSGGERGWRGCHEDHIRNPSEGCPGDAPGSNRSRGVGERGGSRQVLQRAANPPDGSRRSDVQAGSRHGYKHDTGLHTSRSRTLPRVGVTYYPGWTIHAVGSNAPGSMKTVCNVRANTNNELIGLLNPQSVLLGFDEVI